MIARASEILASLRPNSCCRPEDLPMTPDGNRPWWCFTLRTVFVIMTLAAVVCFAVRVEIQSARLRAENAVAPSGK